MLDLGEGHVLVHLLEAQNTEGHVTGFVAHDVAEHLLQQRLLGEVVHEAERRQRQTLDHDLHAQVGHVPVGVVDDVVEQQPQVRVHRVTTVELFVEIPGEGLDVAGLVDGLLSGVVLGVDPRNGLDDFGGAQQCALLTVHELAEAPLGRLETELTPFLVAPRVERRIGILHVGRIHLEFELEVERLVGVNLDRPVEIGGGVPLAGLGFLVELVELGPLTLVVVPGEDGVGVVLHEMDQLIGIVVRLRDLHDAIDVVGVVEVVALGDGHDRSSWSGSGSMEGRVGGG